MLSNQVAKITNYYWFLGLIQVFHSIEETLTKLYLDFTSMSEALHQLFSWFPIINLSADMFAVFNYLIITLMLGSVPAAEQGQKIGLTSMWIWAIVEVLNGAFHIGTWLVLHTYFPGGVSGPILFVLGVIFIQQLRAVPAKTTPIIQ